MHLDRLARTATLTVSLFALALPTTGQSQPSPDQTAKKIGTVFKGPVDGAIRSLLADRSNNGSIGGTVETTAKVLTAMGHCHRFYALSDGPVVRPSIRFLIAHRNDDGSFGTGDDIAITTAWVCEALEVLGGGEAYRELIEPARSWMQQHAPEQSAVFPTVTARAWLKAKLTGADSSAIASRLETGLAEGPSPAACEALVNLVACQYVARVHDTEMGKSRGFSAVQQKAFDFLLSQVGEDGKLLNNFGITALGLAALQTKPATARSAREHQAIREGIQLLLAAQNRDGSFGDTAVNYTTCAVVSALAKSGDPELTPAIEKAQRFILTLQNSEDRGYASGDRDYGSIGYGGDQRGDLSNLQFAIQALRESGLEADHEAFAKAIQFMQRTQNLEEVNDFAGRIRDSDSGEWRAVKSGDDGGAAYYPGNSPAGYVELTDGTKVPRSYGSMTYSLLKAYILCGLPTDDPRIQAAAKWIAKHWTLQENPGADPAAPEKVRYQGLYYYYMVLAQALDTAGMDALTVEKDTATATENLDWRLALREHLAATQEEDGSWINTRNGRWYESQKVLCTTYALLALAHCSERHQ